MSAIKIVARYVNGQIVRGTTHNFQTTGAPLHLLPAGGGTSLEPTKVYLDMPKAVFFVDTFAGDAGYRERKEFSSSDRINGRKAQVNFVDGEKLAGCVTNYDPVAPGFFLFPADPNSNNQKVFAVNASVDSVTFI